MPLTRGIMMHTPSPCGVSRLQHCFVRAGVCICRIIFLTGASNNNNDSFPFVLSFCLFLCSAPFSGGGGGNLCVCPPSPGALSVPSHDPLSHDFGYALRREHFLVFCEFCVAKSLGASTTTTFIPLRPGVNGLIHGRALM